MVVEGVCAPGFEGVRDALVENFEHGDVGAGGAVTIDGEVVVDMWGGHRDLARRRPWAADTLVNIWSTTKMATALCVLMLHDRGALSVDEPMAAYWPEFAANGKEGVLVRHVLSHTAGLPAFEQVPDDIEVFDWDGCCARLAAQAPAWTPGDGSGYHAETQGWLLGELIRRVDGRTMGAFFADEVAAPLGADLHVGVPEDDLHRVADLSVHAAVPMSPGDPDLQKRSHAASFRSAGLVNTTAWRRSEMPASNGHGTAAGVARAMAVLANGGTLDGRRFLSPETIERIFVVQAEGVDRVLGMEMRLGLGYGLRSEATPVVTNERSCWWAGWGGSMCVVDAEHRMTVSYVMNRMQGENDLRAARVVFEAHAAVS